MTHPALIERITRSLAFMLRHQPERFDLALDPYGWASVEDVLRALIEKLGEPISLDDLRAAIESGDRPRYEIQGERVRALYGHSIEVLPGEPAKPPEFLYVGIGSRDADQARQYGLRGGRRRFLHLTRSAEEAREAGRRTGPDYAVLTVFALDAWEEGINFYDRQALFLAEEVPTPFIEIHGSYSDGFAPPQRPFPNRAQGDARQRGYSEGRGGRRRPRGRESYRSEHQDGGERRPQRQEAGQQRAEPAAQRGRFEAEDRPRGRARRDERDNRGGGRSPEGGGARQENYAGERRRFEETRPERPAPAATEPSRPASVVSSPARDEGTPFGLGIFQEPSPRRAAPAEEERSEATRREPPPNRPAPHEEDASPSFGEGI